MISEAQPATDGPRPLLSLVHSATDAATRKLDLDRPGA